MQSKYVMIGGLAFSEEADMEKLKDYASKGWILEGIVGGIFYKLRKDKPENIVYSLDYQTETNEEYFTIFREAGWKHVLSIDNMHIFSAPVGTQPIYSDSESEIDKYTTIRNKTRRGSKYSLITGIVLGALLVCSSLFVKPMVPFVAGLLIIDIILLIFNFMPYLAYNSRIKQIQRYGKCNGNAINNKSIWKIDAVAGVLWLAIGIWHLSGRLYFSAVFYIVGGLFFTISCLIHFKKYKASL